VAVFIGLELGGRQEREIWFALDRQLREENTDLAPGFFFSNNRV
jgi:hypothetical protein